MQTIFTVSSKEEYFKAFIQELVCSFFAIGLFSSLNITLKNIAINV